MTSASPSDPSSLPALSKADEERIVDFLEREFGDVGYLLLTFPVPVAEGSSGTLITNQGRNNIVKAVRKIADTDGACIEFDGWM